MHKRLRIRLSSQHTTRRILEETPFMAVANYYLKT